MKTNKLLIGSLLSTCVLVVCFLSTPKSQACMLNYPTISTSMSNSYSSLTKIHNRLVDEEIKGFNNDNFIFYDVEYLEDGTVKEFLDTSYCEDINGDILFFISLDGKNDETYKNLMSQFGNYVETTYSKLKKYTSFYSPINLLGGYSSFNIYNNILVVDVAKFPQTLYVTKEEDKLLSKIQVIRYIPYTSSQEPDHELKLSNDNDKVNEGISHYSTNSKLVKNGDSTYKLTNDACYTYFQIKNMINAYDGYGNKISDIQRDVVTEYEEYLDNTYNENDVIIGTSYMCLQIPASDEEYEIITIEIESTTNNIQKLLKNNENLIYTNHKSLDEEGIFKQVCRWDMNATNIRVYKLESDIYFLMSGNSYNYNNQGDSYFILYDTVNSSNNTLELEYDKFSVEIDYNSEVVKDEAQEQEDTSQAPEQEDTSHWYDGLLRFLINFINWLCKDEE